MNFDSEELWDEGDPASSMYDEILDFLRENDDRFFVPADIGQYALGDPSIEDGEDLTGQEFQLHMASSVAVDRRTVAILELLVREGLVEKREIPMQAVAQQLDKEHPELQEELPEEVANVPYESDFQGMTSTYYRIARDERE